MSAPIKRLYRSRDEKVIAGVCGGLGSYFGVDPVIIRIVWAILGLSGVGILAYLICWVAIPHEPVRPPADAGAAARP